MSSSFPTSLDSFSTSHADGVGEVLHAATINDLADAVNKIESALGTNAHGDFSTSAINAQTGTAYTLVLGDKNSIVTMTNASSNTLTIPPHSSVAFAVGTIITVAQRGAGQTLIVGGAGVTVNSRGGLSHIAGQYGYVTLIQVATDVWDLTGDLA